MFSKLLILAIAVLHVHALVELRDLHEEHGPVAYEFQYAVHDPHTGDIKSQKEARKDDRVEGVYELIDSDGHRRVVHYKADDHNGFEAVVSREPTNIKIPIPEVHHKLIATKIVTPTLLHH
ncbi:cuticle protein 8 [Anastrepha obliqua]|uniref:cuticle protein 8 n=1 Tax=Anastrepha obliqua TaxID=95512 RepID=UPI002409A4A3|nr:cuticle protein 8 [Anastrepha obliqua]